MNSRDFSLGSWSYDDTAGDYGLANFNTSHDDLYLMPMLRVRLLCRSLGCVTCLIGVVFCLSFLFCNSVLLRQQRTSFGSTSRRGRCRHG